MTSPAAPRAALGGSNDFTGKALLHDTQLQAEHDSATGQLLTHVKIGEATFAPNSALTTLKTPTILVASLAPEQVAA